MRVEGLLVVVAARRPLHGAEAEPAAGERRPGGARVLTAERLRRGHDRTAGDHEARAAALELQPVGDVLDRAEVPTRVPGPVQVRVEPVLVDEIPVEIPQGRCPAVAEAVRQRKAGPVEPAAGLDAVVRERLDRHVPRVRPGPDAGSVPIGLEEGVRPHPARLVRIVERRVEQHRDGEVVAPALARLLVAGEAVDRRAACEAVRDPVPVLVDDDPVLEVAVADPGMVRVLAHGSGGGAGGDRRPDRVPVRLGDARDRNVRHGGRLRSRQDRRGGRGAVCDDQRRRTGRACLPRLLDVLAAVLPPVTMAILPAAPA